MVETGSQPPLSRERVGVIGVGNMGMAVVTRLVAAGFQPVVYDTTATAVEKAVGKGAIAVTSPRAVAESTNTALLFVRTGAQAEAAVLGADGYRRGANKKNVLVLMSSVSPDSVITVAKGLGTTGATVLDAPVSGGAEGAAAGSLTIMIAGDKAARSQVDEVLAAIGGRIYWLGEDVGDGQTMKALNQALYFACSAASAEVVALGVKAGLDPDMIVDVIGHGSGDNWALRNRIPLAWRAEYRSGGSVSVAIKDLETAMNLATSLDAPLSVTASALDLWRETAITCPSADDPSIVKTAEARADVSIRQRDDNVDGTRL